MLVLTPTTTNTVNNGILEMSVVVPCFNEEAGLDQLVERLKTVRRAFEEKVHLEFVLVDDGSTDGTAAGLEARFQPLGFAKVIRHEVNRGITAAIMTGMNEATHDLVASMDADCTYDPMQLASLLDLMDDQTAMVTASPYHPRGSVEGVPGWRLMLSKSASWGYGILLGLSLHTYTSCFRLHRRSYMTKLDIRESGFVGVAEMLWQTRRNGGRIVEVPAVLTSRRIGFSKMRTIPVILAHLRLMARIAVDRLLSFNKYSTPKVPH